MVLKAGNIESSGIIVHLKIKNADNSDKFKGIPQVIWIEEVFFKLTTTPLPSY